MNTELSATMQNDDVTLAMSRFEAAFRRGVEGIVDAAKIYVAAIDADMSYADRFREHFSGMIPLAVWSQLEAVGRKWMHPSLLLGVVGDRKISGFIKKLSYAEQEKVFRRERVPLLLPSGDKLLIAILDATPDQVEQLCNGTTLRDEAQQRAWMEAGKMRDQRAKAEELPYFVRDGKVTFRRGFTADKAVLRTILKEM